MMKTLLLGAATLAIAATSFAGQAPPDQAPPPVSAAQRSFEAGQYNQAIEAVAAARQPATAGPQETFLAAHAYLKLGQNDKAREEFTRLAESSDEMWRAIGMSANALIANEVDRALELATRPTAKINEQATAGTGLTDASRMQAAQPQNFHAFFQLGLVKTRKEDWAGAAEAFERAAQLNPAFAYSHYYAGLAFSRLRRPDRMAVHFETFLKLAPNAPERSAVTSLMRTIRGM